jgi:hypothetical protein
MLEINMIHIQRIFMKNVAILAVLISSPLLSGPQFFIDNKSAALLDVQEKTFINRREGINYIATVAPKSRQQITFKNNGQLMLFPKGPGCGHRDEQDDYSENCSNSMKNPINVQPGKTLEVQAGENNYSLKSQWK